MFRYPARRQLLGAGLSLAGAAVLANTPWLPRPGPTAPCGC
ncbi:hypothetical protein ACFQU7_28140 [Pseudoroseomonas wenyumeiae]